MKLSLFISITILLLCSATYASASNDVGEAVYSKSCAACHASGVLNAPKLDDKEAWSGLIAKGAETLTANAIKGIGKMPPKGGNMKLTDEEVKAAVAYMIEAGK